MEKKKRVGLFKRKTNYKGNCDDENDDDDDDDKDDKEYHLIKD